MFSTIHLRKTPALLLDPVAGRRAVTHCQEHNDVPVACGHDSSHYAVWGALQQVLLLVYQRR